MSNGKIVLNSSGVRNLLKSAEIKKACADQLKGLQSMCSDPCTVDTYVGKTRANAMLTGSHSDIEKIKEALR